MTPVETIRLVAGRELRERVRSKAFLASTAFSLLLVLAVAIIPGLIRGDGGPTKYKIGVVGTAAAPITDRLVAVAAASGEDVRVDVRAVADLAEAERLVKAGTLDLALAGNEVLVDESSGELEGLVQDAHREAAHEAALAKAGMSGAAVTAALRPAPLPVRELDPPDKDAKEREGLIFVGSMLLYGQLLGFGYWVATGILEEKASRVVEVVLAKARPAHVLAGKILGIGVLGFVQLIGFVIVGLATAWAVGTIELPALVFRVAVEVIAWFVLGFALYACLFAAAGALASRTEEMQNTTGPVTLVAIMSFFAAMFATGDPGGTAARISTFLPPAAPMVLPIRSAAGELALWEAGLSVALVLVATLGAVWLAGRVYAGSALNVRGPMKLREALSRSG